MEKTTASETAIRWTGYRLRCLHPGTYPKPEVRQGHIMVDISPKESSNSAKQYFLFGGRGSSKANAWKDMTKQQRLGKKKQRRYLNDTWILSIQDDYAQWERVDNDGGSTSSPSPRWSAAGFFYENAVYVHGGRGLDNFFDDLWKFDLKARGWMRVESTGHSPPPVNGHSLARHDNKLYLFGGSYSWGRERRYVGDTYMLNLTTFSWSKIAGCLGPSPRYWHSTVQQGQYWFLVGGFAFAEFGSECYFNDIWRFDLEQHEWKEIQIPDAKFHRRNRCGVAAMDSQSLIIFGGNYFGSRWQDIFLNEVSLLDIDSKIMVTNIPCVEGESLAVGHHTFLSIAGATSPSFLVFGGEDGSQRFNDVMVLSLVKC